MSEITTIIITGGTATRMRPLSLDRAKCMIPFMGNPLLLHILNLLKYYNFKNIIFTSPGKNNEIRSFFSDGKKLDLSIEYYEGSRWYGTAGTIKNIVSDMDHVLSRNLLIIYGDSLLHADFARMVKIHSVIKSSCTVLFHRPKFDSFKYEYHDRAFDNHGPRTNYGVLDLVDNNQISKVIEKPVIARIDNDFVNPVANAAVYTIKKEVFELVPASADFDFPKDLFPLLIKEKIPCFGCDIEDGFRLDLGTIPTYYTAQFMVLSGKLRFKINFPLFEDGVWFGHNLKLLSNLKKPILICNDCSVGENSHIENSIIGNNVKIGNGCQIKKSIILDHTMIENGVHIENCIIGENCYIGTNTVLPSNTILGNYCELGKNQLDMPSSEFSGLLKA